jgi:undecaprenyl-diphosphatase
MPRRTLIPARQVRPDAVAVVVALAVLASLVGWLHDRSHTAFDDWTARQLALHIGPSLSQILLGCSSPALSVFVPAAVLLCAACTRRWDLAALAVSTPLAATVLCELVGKPLVDRVIAGSALSFPSGHETGVGAAAGVLAVALGQLPLQRRTRVLWHAGLVVWVVAAGLGLVRAHYHYVTDVVGALALTTAVVLGTALLIDQVVAGDSDSSRPMNRVS